MGKKINDLDPVLLAIGRQIAEQKAISGRADHPVRDLPILLIPNAGHPLTGTESRTEQALPYLLGAAGQDQPAPTEPARDEATGQGPELTPPPHPVHPILRPDILGGRA